MKISKHTLAILKNFSEINPNIVINPDTKTIMTVCPSKKMFAQAEIYEEFPHRFGIYDLPKLLNTVDMFDTPVFDFNEKFMTIKEENSNTSFKYFFSPPEHLTYPSKSALGEYDTPVSFKLAENTIEQIMKTSKITKLPNLRLEYDGVGSVALQVMDRNSRTSNVFSVNIPANGDSPVDAFIDVEYFKVIPTDYGMEFGKGVGIMHGVSKEFPTLKYIVAMKV